MTRSIAPEQPGMSAPARMNPMTPQDEWTELEKLALAATPGEWRSVIDDTGGPMSGWPLCIVPVNDDDRTVVRTGGMWPYEWAAKVSQHEAVQTAAFIAAANPSTVRKLIAAARANAVGTDGSEAAGSAPSNPTRAEAVGAMICRDRMSPADLIACATANATAMHPLSNLRDLLEQMAKALTAPPSTEAVDLHPATVDLVDRFASALKIKLAAAEKKYGYSDGWLSDHWQDELVQKLAEHVNKGDPRDVAAFCAFAWHHGWSIAPPSTEEGGGLRDTLKRIAEFSDDVVSREIARQALARDGGKTA